MPYTKVVAIGDSFTRGDELADCQLHNTNDFSAYSRKTWPALVANNLQVDYDCIATGGRGNQWISWQVSRLLHRLENHLVIINWSWFARFDYIDAETDTWKTTHPRHEDKLDHYFYRNYDSDIWNLHRNLQQMHSTIALLQQNKINFLMTCLDPLLHTKSFGETPAHKTWQDVTTSLQDQVLHYILNFYGYTFLEWAKHKNFEIGPGGHPLENAHTEAAKYINTHTIYRKEL